MRKKSAAFFVCTCALIFPVLYPANALALKTSSLPATLPLQCPKGSPTGDPTDSKTFTMSQVAELRTYLRQIVYCANACYDEDVTVAVSVSLDGSSVKVSASIPSAGNKCGTPNPIAADLLKANRGCASGETQPKVTVHVPAISVAGVPDKTIGPKSRCDARLGDITDSAFAAASNKDINGFKDALAQMDSLSATAPPVQNAGTDALTKALTDFGVPQDQAQTIAKGTASTADLIKAIQSGDPAAASDALKKAADAAGVTLNPDLLNKISSLTPDALKQTADTLANTLNDIANGSTFGPSAADLAQQAARPQGGVFSPMLGAAEKQYNLDTIAPNGLAKAISVESLGDPHICNGDACGLYQITSGTWRDWSSQYNLAKNGDPTPLPLNDRLDPQISTDVTAYVWGQRWNQYGNLIQQAGLDPTTGLYALHNLGSGDGPKFLQALATNPNASIISVISPAAVAGNRGFYGDGSISVAQAAQNLTSKLNGGSTAFTGRSTYPFRAVSGAGLTGQTIGAALSSILSGGGGNPFGIINPNYQLSQPGYYSSGSGVSSGGSSQIQIQPPMYDKNSRSSMPQPAATIIVNPSSTTPGTRIQVIWSSVGMQPSKPCGVFVNDVYQIGQGNEGSAFATSTSANTGDTWKFTLRCTAYAGGVFEKTTPVTFH